MTERLPDERLAEIRASYPLNDNRRWETEDAIESFEAVRELLAEVDRMRALETPPRLWEVPADSVTPEQVTEWQAAWDEFLRQPQERQAVRILPVLPDRAAAAEYLIGVDAEGDSSDWVYVQHLPCETDVYSGRDDREPYTADRLVGTMLAHRCEGTANRAEPRRLEYPMGG